MDKKLVFLLIIFLTKGNAQLRCFVCTNCPNEEDLDVSIVRSCGVVPPTTPAPSAPPISPIPSLPPISPTPPTATPPSTVTAPPTATTPPHINTEEVTITIETEIPSSLARKYGYAYIAGTHQCFRIERRVDDGIQVDRGCVVAASTNHATCVLANSGITPLGCRICGFNECNSGSTNRTSLIIVFFGIAFMRIFSQ